MLDGVGLLGKAGDRASAYSGGMKRRLSVAMYIYIYIYVISYYIHIIIL